VCPTRSTTLSPRQRIILLREIREIDQRGESMPDDLAQDYAEMARGSCVRDSMCITACPVKIDTGLLMKELDQAESSIVGRSMAGFAATNFGTTAKAARMGLSLGAGVLSGNALTRGVMTAGASLLHALAPALVPHIDAKTPLPRPAPPVPKPTGTGVRDVVYFPSCVSRIVGALPGESELSTMEATLRCLEASGRRVIIPANIEGLCCGLAFSSKSHDGAAQRSMSAAQKALSEATRGGELAVVTDASPCALQFAQHGPMKIRVLDFVQYWRREVMTEADAPKGVLRGRAILHPTCSLTKLDAVEDLKAVAAAHSEDPVVPLRAACCGFAGNQGFVRPEITEGATRAEAEDVRGLMNGAETAYSTCRTCEIGMTRATKLSYASAAHLVYRALGLKS
ncbi:MAG: (Fe-S)-binding protein, partial [Vicinamibacteria bacterium]